MAVAAWEWAVSKCVLKRRELGNKKELLALTEPFLSVTHCAVHSANTFTANPQARGRHRYQPHSTEEDTENWCLRTLPRVTQLANGGQSMETQAT